jgi:hypothetical protein
VCDIFGCSPNDLIEPYITTTSQRGRKTGAAATSNPAKALSRNRPTCATIRGADQP